MSEENKAILRRGPFPDKDEKGQGLLRRRSGHKNHRDDMTTTSRLGSLACLPGVASILPVSRGC
jgi:hypothetical protein